jgi:hypothetical protein
MASGMRIESGAHNVFVNLTGSGNQSGTSEADAMTLTTACALGAASARDIWVRSGTSPVEYPVTATLNVTLGGPFSAGMPRPSRILGYATTPGDLAVCDPRNPRIVPAASGLASGTVLVSLNAARIALVNVDIRGGVQPVIALRLNASSQLVVGCDIQTVHPDTAQTGTACISNPNGFAAVVNEDCRFIGGDVAVANAGLVRRCFVYGRRVAISNVNSGRCVDVFAQQVSQAANNDFNSGHSEHCIYSTRLDPYSEFMLQSIERSLILGSTPLPINFVSEATSAWRLRRVMVAHSTVGGTPSLDLADYARMAFDVRAIPHPFQGALSRNALDMRLGVNGRADRDMIELMQRHLDVPYPVGTLRDSAATLDGYLAELTGYVLPPEITFTTPPIASVSAERVLTTTTGTVTTATAGAATITVEWEQLLAGQWEEVNGAGAAPFTGIGGRSYRSKITASKTGFTSVTLWSNPVLAPVDTSPIEQNFFGFTQTLSSAPRQINAEVLSFPSNILYGELTL